MPKEQYCILKWEEEMHLNRKIKWMEKGVSFQYSGYQE